MEEEKVTTSSSDDRARHIVSLMRQCADPETIIDECDQAADCPYSNTGTCMNDLILDAADILEAYIIFRDTAASLRHDLEDAKQELKISLLDRYVLARDFAAAVREITTLRDGGTSVDGRSLKLENAITCIKVLDEENDRLIDEVDGLREQVPKQGVWEHVHGVFTPGGDPMFRCPFCHGRYSEHVSGIESHKVWNYCPVCGVKLTY